VSIRDERDKARDRLDDLRGTTLPAVTVSADDRDDPTLAEQRELVRPRRARADGVEVRGMNEYRVTIIGAGFDSSSGWIYTADAPPAPGDEIEITSERSSSLGGGVSREFVRVDVIRDDGSISAEEII
jgi:hypothetical protein